MEVVKREWLSHLKDVIPIEARKNRTSMYTIALEGWKRGLDLTFYNLSENNRIHIRYSLGYKGREHHFDGSGGDLNTDKAVKICEDKGLSYKYLSKENVSIPKSKSFARSVKNEEIMNYSESISYPLVVKPVNASGGHGVVANIKNQKELIESLYYVRETLSYDEVIVQQFIEGEEIRVFVIDNKVIGAANRIPANIIGDGRNSIKMLIRNKNQLRKQVPHLYYRPIKIDREVKKMIENAGYSLDSIPKVDERIFLRQKSNVSAGGDPVDFTDNLTDKQKKVAINAVKAIPGLEHAGVDLMIDKHTNDPYVLEVNTKPGIGSHLFPMEGKARDIPKTVIDYYFPETKGINVNNNNFYFDFRGIYESLINRAVIKIEVPKCPGNSLFAKRFIVKGQIELVSYFQWLHNHVLEKQLNGFIRRIDNQRIEVILGGTDIYKLGNLQSILASPKFSVEQLDTEDWKSPIQLGFELKDGLQTLSLSEIEGQIKEIRQNVRLMEKEKKRVLHRIKLVHKSNSWKLMTPVRYVSKKIKRW